MYTKQNGNYLHVKHTKTRTNFHMVNQHMHEKLKQKFSSLYFTTGKLH